jgi:hypothetical protein
MKEDASIAWMELPLLDFESGPAYPARVLLIYSDYYSCNEVLRFNYASVIAQECLPSADRLLQAFGVSTDIHFVGNGPFAGLKRVVKQFAEYYCSNVSGIPFVSRSIFTIKLQKLISITNSKNY